MPVKHTYAGEMLFKRYSDTSTQGQTVTFALPSREEMEPFIGLEGKRFQAVFVLLGDDEMPEQDTPKPKERERLGGLGWWAVMRCKEPEFQSWLLLRYGAEAHGANEPDAAAMIYSVCGISSRRELDTNEKAAAIFKTAIMEPYRRYLAKQGEA